MDNREFNKLLHRLNKDVSLRKRLREEFIAGNGIHRFPGNATFRHMRVKPTRMTLTPAHPTNIWARFEYFKPQGRGVRKG